jgi:hypothetical protein
MRRSNADCRVHAPPAAVAQRGRVSSGARRNNAPAGFPRACLLARSPREARNRPGAMQHRAAPVGNGPLELYVGPLRSGYWEYISIERQRGIKEESPQLGTLRERWPLAFPVQHQDIRPWHWAWPTSSPREWAGRFPTRSACFAAGKWERSTARPCFPETNVSPLMARRPSWLTRMRRSWRPRGSHGSRRATPPRRPRPRQPETEAGAANRSDACNAVAAAQSAPAVAPYVGWASRPFVREALYHDPQHVARRLRIDAGVIRHVGSP